MGQDIGQDAKNVFRVEEGEIVVSYDAYPEFDNTFGHLFFDELLSDYRLRFEYRFTGIQAKGGPGWAFMNSGVMVHAQAPGTMQVDQAFPVSIEAQLLGMSADLPERTTANICTPGTHVEIAGELETAHCITSETLAAPADTWVQFELEVRGQQLMRLIINGEEAFRLSALQYDPSDEDTQRLGHDGPLGEGHFALQAESHPVAFRNIELMRLNPADGEF